MLDNSNETRFVKWYQARRSPWCCIKMKSPAETCSTGLSLNRADAFSGATLICGGKSYYSAKGAMRID
jgi:hypothetical protein